MNMPKRTRKRSPIEIWRDRLEAIRAMVNDPDLRIKIERVYVRDTIAAERLIELADDLVIDDVLVKAAFIGFSLGNCEARWRTTAVMSNALGRDAARGRRQKLLLAKNRAKRLSKVRSVADERRERIREEWQDLKSRGKQKTYAVPDLAKSHHISSRTVWEYLKGL